VTNPDPFELGSDEDFIALDVVKRAIRAWWLVILLVALGGLVGLGATRLLPMEYEGGFNVLTGVDQVNSGALTQYAQDVMMDAVGGILVSPVTMEKVVNAARAQGIQVDVNQLQSNITMERQVSTWQLRIRRPNRAEVDQLAQLWVNIGADDLKEAYAHAQKADGLKRYLSSLESCLSRAVTSEPADGTCNPDNLKGIQNEMESTGAALTQELGAARGLSSGVLINLLEKDLTPARALQNQRGPMVLAGGLIGLILGIWAAQTGLGDALGRHRRG
jgi:hypothetical protein